MPWKSTTKEIYQDIRNRFEIVTAGLLYAQVGVDRHVSGSAGEILVLPVGDMEVSFGVAEFLCEAKINYIDLVSARAKAHQEVVWFDIAMNEVARVDIFDARNLTAVRMRKKTNYECTDHLISK